MKTFQSDSLGLIVAQIVQKLRAIRRLLEISRFQRKPISKGINAGEELTQRESAGIAVLRGPGLFRATLGQGTGDKGAAGMGWGEF